MCFLNKTMLNLFCIERVVWDEKKINLLHLSILQIVKMDCRWLVKSTVFTMKCYIVGFLCMSSLLYVNDMYDSCTIVR